VSTRKDITQTSNMSSLSDGQSQDKTEVTEVSEVCASINQTVHHPAGRPLVIGFGVPQGRGCRPPAPPSTGPRAKQNFKVETIELDAFGDPILNTPNVRPEVPVKQPAKMSGAPSLAE
jgi:hypothetical protein